MTKQELVQQVSEAAQITQFEAKRAIDTVFNSIVYAVKDNGSFTQVGFGSFKQVIRKERKGKNPKTQKEIHIPERRALVFRPAPKLRSL